MSGLRTRRGSGPPSLCWHCLRQLQRAPGRGLGLFHFHLVRDPGGATHRVHDACLTLCVADGNHHVKES